MRTTEMEITPFKAMEMLKNNTRNRPFKKNTVEFYAEQMRKGLWKRNGETIIISETNKLMDGQHRLAAIVKSGTTQTFIVVLGVSDDAFPTIDTGTARSGGDVLGIDGVKNATTVSSIITKYVSLKLNYTGVVKSKINTKLSKFEILEIYKSDKLFFDEITKESYKYKQKLNLLQQSFIGGYICYLIKEKKHNPEKVYSFFKQLIYNENIENQTIVALRDKLLKNKIGQYSMTPAFKHAIFTKTWNCYIKGKELKVLYYGVGSEIMPELF